MRSETAGAEDWTFTGIPGREPAMAEDECTVCGADAAHWCETGGEPYCSSHYDPDHTAYCRPCRVAR